MRTAFLLAPALAGLVALTLVASPGSARAASFDCARARGADEVAVCRNPALSALDSEMGGLWYAYSRVPMAMGGNGNRGDDARAFLARRRACGGNALCLTTAYRVRIQELRRGIYDSMEEYSRLMFN